MAKYSTLTAEEASALLHPFGLVLHALEPMPGGASNSSFLATTDRGRHVLTVLDNHDDASATTLTSTMEYVRAHGVCADELERDASGAVFAGRSGGHPVILKRHFVGHDLAGACPEQLAEIGCALGRVHLLPAPGFLPAGARMVPAGWRDVLAGRRGISDLRATLERAEATSSSQGWRELPVGLCHGDLFADNLIRRSDGGQLVILDWETASIDPFILDVGIACVAFALDSPRPAAETARHLVAGYESVRVLPEMERLLLADACHYALALLAYHRYVRHNIRFPRADMRHHYRPLLAFANREFPALQSSPGVTVSLQATSRP